jgi:hypothetical protein
LEEGGQQVFRQVKLGTDVIECWLEEGGLQLLRRVKLGTDMVDCWLEDGVLKQLMERPDELMIGRHCSWDLELCFPHFPATADISARSTC